MLTTYLKTFLSVFVILMLIFVLQTIWLYIKELAGKDLDIVVIVKFLAYFMPKLIPLVLPLTILLASIMVFGSFAENYEFAAMKSTGISLQRAMSGLSVFIVILGIVTFFFSNNVIPWAELNSYNLRKNIAKLKPAMLLAEGQFNPVGTYNIKFVDKYGDRDQFLKDVTIHVKDKTGRKNATVIKSKIGELASEKDSNVLKLILSDGHYYSDVSPQDRKALKRKPFAKSTFETKIINIDLSNLNNVDFDEQSQTDKYNMLNVSGLNKTIDSLVTKYGNENKTFAENLHLRSGLNRNYPVDRKVIDSLSYTGPILDLFDTKQKIDLVDVASKSMISSKQLIITKDATMKNSKAWLNKHVISLHEKFALGFACVILFFVGAPLGALIRKGGIGLPMVIAILLFLTYHFIGIFATNSAKNGGFNPIIAPWFSTLIMLPLGIFLTRRATADRGLIEGEGLFEFLKKLFGIKKATIDEDTTVFESKSSEYIDLLAYDNNRLIDIIKNYREYSYSSKYRNTALSIINTRGISTQQLKFSGNLFNEKYEEAIRLKNKFEEDSKLAFILYIIFYSLTLIGLVLENNKFELIGSVLSITGIISGIFYLFSLVKSFISSSNFYKHLEKASFSNALIFLLVGFPLYFLIYLFQKKKMNEELNINVKAKTEQQSPITSENCNELQFSANNYNEHSKFAITLYIIGVVLLILFFVFKNNELLPLATASIQLSIVSLVLFLVYFIKSIINTFQFYNHIGKKQKTPNVFLLILGIPFYFITYLFLNQKMKDDLKTNCLESLK
nr:LptF/LptG family permease [Algibacter marinivivus]